MTGLTRFHKQRIDNRARDLTLVNRPQHAESLAGKLVYVLRGFGALTPSSDWSLE
jgi:hypothetical protein